MTEMIKTKDNLATTKSSLFYAPFSSLALASLASGFFTTFVTIYLYIIKASAIHVGLAQSAYYFGMLVGSLTTERQISKLGHVRAYAVYITFAATFILELAFFKNHISMWILARFIIGYSLAGIYVVLEGWLLGLTNRSNRGTILTLYTTVLYAASAFGQFLIDLVDNKNDHPYILVSLIWCLAALPVLLTNKKIPAIKEVPKLKIITIFANDRISNLGCLIAGLALSVVYSYGPSYAQLKHIDVPTMMFTIVIGGTVLPIIFGKLSDLVDRRLIIIGLSVLSLPIFVSFFLWFGAPSLRLAANFIIGGCLFAIYPICISKIIDCTPEDYIMPATAVALFFYGIGATIGPIFFGALISLTTLKLFYPYLAVCSAALMLLMIRSIYSKQV